MATNALGTIFVAIGFLAGIAGLGLMYFSSQDEASNDGGWFFHDQDRTEANQQRYDAGQISVVGGALVLVVGLILLVVSRR